MEDKVTENVRTHLKHVLENIGRLLPSSYKVLIPFSHQKIEILMLFPGYDTIVIDSFLVTSHCVPRISMEGFR